MTLDQKLIFWNVVGEWLCGVATLLAVFVSFRLARGSAEIKRLSEKRRNAAELYTSFTSMEMVSARAEAANFLRANNASAKPLSLQMIYLQEDPRAMIAVNRMIQFWEQTWMFIESDYVENELTRKLLRTYFEGHYRHFLARLIEIGRISHDEPSYLQWTYNVENLAKLWNVGAPQSSPP